MAFTTPTVRATTDLITSAIWNADIVANINWLATDAPYCRVYHTIDQNMSNATTTETAFNTERFDNASMHDTATNNTRITATVAGKYVVGGGITFAPNATGVRIATIYRNGVASGTQIAQNGFQSVPGGIFPTAVAVPSPFDSFAINDYAVLAGYQSSGGALAVQAIGNVSPEFWAYLIRI